MQSRSIQLAKMAARYAIKYIADKYFFWLFVSHLSGYSKFNKYLI